MPRKPQVNYFESRGGYFTQWKGKQVPLASGPDDRMTGPTYLAALEAFKQLFMLENVDQAKDRNTCRVILERYLQHIETRRKAKTVSVRQHYYVAFCAHLGEEEVGQLTHHQIYRWLDEMRKPRLAVTGGEHNRGTWQSKWSDGSIRNAIDSLSVAFRWAMKTSLITFNPIFGLESPKARSRGRYAVLADTKAEQVKWHQLILAAASPSFRPIIVALENTGCRPGELTAATAKDWKDSLGALVYYPDDGRLDPESFSHKTGSKGKDRIIRFAGESLAMMRQLVRDRPKGPLFRTKEGNPWHRNQLQLRFRIIRKKVGHPRLTAYSYRHTFATNWLTRGLSIDVLAELLGNTPAIIRKHYSHLCADHQSIRSHLEEFKKAEEIETSLAVPCEDGYFVVDW